MFQETVPLKIYREKQSTENKLLKYRGETGAGFEQGEFGWKEMYGFHICCVNTQTYAFMMKLSEI